MYQTGNKRYQLECEFLATYTDRGVSRPGEFKKYRKLWLDWKSYKTMAAVMDAMRDLKGSYFRFRVRDIYTGDISYYSGDMV